MKKPKVLMVLLISISIFLLTLCHCVYFQETTCIDNVYFTLSADDNVREQVSLYKVDNIYFAFLPSYADLSSTTISVSTGYTLYINGQEYRPNTNCSALVCDHEYTIAIKNSLGITICEENLVIKKSEHIPTLSLHLSNGSLENLHSDKNISKSGTALIVNEDKSIHYIGIFKALHGRGNSTWSQPKKSYSLEFETETDLLGMGAGTGWVLLANSLDESSLRNKLVYDTAKSLGLPYSSNTAYIDLYVDNKYQGLYLLAERVDIGANRVDITNLQENTQAVNQLHLSNYTQIENIIDGKVQRGYNIVNNPSDISGGYLLQIEHHDDRINTKESLIQTNKLSFSLSHPKYASQKQIEYISEYMNTVENQIKSGDTSGIDIDSIALLYLIQEFFANTDNCSVFFYKDTDSIDSKLYAGPIWDFDLSMGNGFGTSDIRPDFLHQNNDNWFNYLLECEDFTNRLHQLYWNDFRPKIFSLINTQLQQYKDSIEASFHMDKLRWKDMSSEYNNWVDTCQKHFETLDEHIERIEDFLENRCAYLDVIWGKQEDYVVLTFQSNRISNYSKKFYLKFDTSLLITPNPTSVETTDYNFLGWFNSEGVQYDPNTIPTVDTTYTAKWEKIDENVQSNAPFSLFNNLGPLVTKNTLLVSVISAAVLVFVMCDIAQGIKNKRYNKNDE